MQPKTLEEALEVINKLSQDNAKLQEKVETVINEKKEVLKMFDEKELEGMSENERKLAENLENISAENAKLKKQIELDAKNREQAEKETLTKKIEERIVRVAKGDKEFEAKLRANVDLLEKLPKTTDTELDSLIDSAYKLTGQKDANPLNISGSANNADIAGKTNFVETEQGKALAEKFGISLSDNNNNNQ